MLQFICRVNHTELKIFRICRWFESFVSQAWFFSSCLFRLGSLGSADQGGHVNKNKSFSYHYRFCSNTNWKVVLVHSYKKIIFRCTVIVLINLSCFYCHAQLTKFLRHSIQTGIRTTVIQTALNIFAS